MNNGTEYVIDGTQNVVDDSTTNIIRATPIQGGSESIY